MQDSDRLCEVCLTKLIIPKLREDDIAVMQYLYNENINIAQVAMHKTIISKNTNLSQFKTQMALVRLQCYNMVDTQPWSKLDNYYLKYDAIIALNILSKKIGG